MTTETTTPKCSENCARTYCRVCRNLRLADVYAICNTVWTNGSHHDSKGTGHTRYVIDRYGPADTYAHALVVANGYVEYVTESPIGYSQLWRMQDDDGSLAQEIRVAMATAGVRPAWRWQPETVA